MLRLATHECLAFAVVLLLRLLSSFASSHCSLFILSLFYPYHHSHYPFFPTLANKNIFQIILAEPVIKDNSSQSFPKPNYYRSRSTNDNDCFQRLIFFSFLLFFQIITLNFSFGDLVPAVMSVDWDQKRDNLFELYPGQPLQAMASTCQF